MKRSTHHLLTAVVLAIFFLHFATIGYGAFSDSLSASGSISWVLPTLPSYVEDNLADSAVSLYPLVEEGAQATPAQTDGPDAILPEEGLSNLEDLEPAPTYETQDTPQETAVPENIIFEPEVSVSSVCFKSSDSTAKGISSPYFSYTYTDRSGNQVQKSDNAIIYHWKNSMLVAYANVYIPQNGLPGTAILANMNLSLGAAICITNTTGADMLLSRTSASGGMEQSFFNNAERKLAENSVRLAPGQAGIVSAYLGQGLQLNALELDLENLPGMSCTHEYKMSFQAENPQTGESRMYAILLVISVSTLAPAETPLPTESDMVIVTPAPTPMATVVPAVEPTPSPVATEEVTATPTPMATDVLAVEPTPSPVATEEVTATPTPMATDVLAIEPTPSPVVTEEVTATPTPMATDVPAVEPTPSQVATGEITATPATAATDTPAVEAMPSPVSTEEIMPTPVPTDTDAPVAEQTLSPVSTEEIISTPVLESTPAASSEVVSAPEPSIEVTVNTPELLPEAVLVSDNVQIFTETTVIEATLAKEPPPALISAPEGVSQQDATIPDDQPSDQGG